MKRKIILALPSFGAFAWLLWHCVQAKWSEVIAPNFGWLLLGTGVATGIVWWLTRKKISETLIAGKQEENIVPQERLVAREIYTWKTVTRERRIYAKPK